ncbi:MBL fold metallo-hydrolase [Hydrocarboniphaga effusa]|jgi:hypothetical protein|uniref:MBL fold metallo-hydrolase n=1 Tax=Hydrocarboniphaga effusa TaxID=243629 RepID=UPI003137F90B
MGISNLQSNPPAADEIEVSLIGPNIGECVVVHVGDNRWIIVDSCLDDQSGRPAALAYLEALNVSPQSVVLVVATHWHDDHIRGLVQILEACDNASFCASPLMNELEFMSAICAYNKEPLTASGSGVQELYRATEYLARLGRPIVRALESRMIRRWGDGQPMQSEIWTLSPSDEGFNRFIASAKRITPTAKQTQHRAPLILPNDTSVVLQVVIGQVSVLLGADLEESGDARFGWSAILGSQGKPAIKSQVFKVPHHGSSNGHHPDVWSKMLSPDPIAVLAPYSRSPRLPQNSDIDRIVALAPKSFSSSIVASKRAKISRAPDVERILQDFGLNLQKINLTPGVVQARFAPGRSAEWSVELFNGALPLTSLKQLSGRRNQGA